MSLARITMLCSTSPDLFILYSEFRVFQTPVPVPQLPRLHPATHNHHSTLFLRVHFIFLDSTSKWDHLAFVFLWLISLSMTPTRFVHVTNGRISFFVAENIPVCSMPQFLCLFIHQWSCRLFLGLGCCEYYCSESHLFFLPVGSRTDFRPQLRRHLLQEVSPDAWAETGLRRERHGGTKELSNK